MPPAYHRRMLWARSLKSTKGLTGARPFVYRLGASKTREVSYQGYLGIEAAPDKPSSSTSATSRPGFPGQTAREPSEPSCLILARLIPHVHH